MTKGNGYSAEFIAAALRKSATIEEEGCLEMEFTAANGRNFLVRERDDGRYFACEMIPNGRFAEAIEGKEEFRYFDWDGHRWAKDNPNGYVDAVIEAGYSRDHIIRCGAGYSIYSRYIETIEQVAEEIAGSLRSNRYFDDLDRELMADPEFKAKLEADEEESRRQYWEDQRKAHEAAVEDEHGIFKGLHAMVGPLSDGAKQRILSFLNSPSKETWDDCARLMIKGHVTMWSLWCETDRNAVRSLDAGGEWPRIPDVEQMRAALRELGDATPEPRGVGRRL
jgi:hypothetical protein